MNFNKTLSKIASIENKIEKYKEIDKYFSSIKDKSLSIKTKLEFIDKLIDSNEELKNNFNNNIYTNISFYDELICYIGLLAKHGCNYRNSINEKSIFYDSLFYRGIVSFNTSILSRNLNTPNVLDFGRFYLKYDDKFYLKNKAVDIYNNILLENKINYNFKIDDILDKNSGNLIHLKNIVHLLNDNKKSSPEITIKEYMKVANYPDTLHSLLFFSDFDLNFTEDEVIDFLSDGDYFSFFVRKQLFDKESTKLILNRLIMTNGMFDHYINKGHYYYIDFLKNLPDECKSIAFEFLFNRLTQSSSEDKSNIINHIDFNIEHLIDLYQSTTNQDNKKIIAEKLEAKGFKNFIFL